MGWEEAARSVKAARMTCQRRPRGSCNIPQPMSARSPRSARICFHFKSVLQSGLDWDLYVFYVASTTHCASQEMTVLPRVVYSLRATADAQRPGRSPLASFFL